MCTLHTAHITTQLTSTSRCTEAIQNLFTILCSPKWSWFYIMDETWADLNFHSYTYIVYACWMVGYRTVNTRASQRRITGTWREYNTSVYFDFEFWLCENGRNKTPTLGTPSFIVKFNNLNVIEWMLYDVRTRTYVSRRHSRFGHFSLIETEQILFIILEIIEIATHWNVFRKIIQS